VFIAPFSTIDEFGVFGGHWVVIDNIDDAIATGCDLPFLLCLEPVDDFGMYVSDPWPF
jgi:hypothetical protein